MFFYGKNEKYTIYKGELMKDFMGLKYSRQGLTYIIAGSLLLLGALGILNWHFAWIILSIGAIVYGLMLSGAGEVIKCKTTKKK